MSKVCIFMRTSKAKCHKHNVPLLPDEVHYTVAVEGVVGEVAAAAAAVVVAAAAAAAVVAAADTAVALN